MAKALMAFAMSRWAVCSVILCVRRMVLGAARNMPTAL
jgi:hypothetical protein